MAPFKFFYDLLSPPSRALYIFFKFNKIEHEAISVALRKGKTYFSMPFITDDGDARGGINSGGDF